MTDILDRLIFKREFYNKQTISDDRSAGSKIEERNLLALRDRGPKIQESQQSFLGQNNALQDYQMQLMLLEQQNKKRLLMARQEPDFKIKASAVAAYMDKSKELDDHTIRTDIKQVLDQTDPSEIDLRKLQEYIGLLQESIQSRPAPSRYQIIYRIQRSELVKHRNNKHSYEELSTLFFDHPEWVRGQGTESHIKSNLPLTNFELYLEKNKDVSFIVYQTFTELDGDNNGSDRTAHRPQPANETVRLVDKDLIDVIKDLLDSQPQYEQLARDFSASLELPAPYLFVFHSRKNLEKFQDSLPVNARAQLTVLLNYVMEQYADEYATADSLLSQNKISPKFLRYLFKPGDLLISRADGQYQGYVSQSWPVNTRTRTRMRAATPYVGAVMPLYGSQEADIRMTNDKVTVHSCSVSVWYWDFDGSFQRQSTMLYLEIVEDGVNDSDIKGKRKVTAQGDTPGNDMGEKNISDLNVFPIQYASAEIVDICRRRGKTFWKCRTRSYVSYQTTERDSIQNLVSCVVTRSLGKPLKLICRPMNDI